MRSTARSYPAFWLTAGSRELRLPRSKRTSPFCPEVNPVQLVSKKGLAPNHRERFLTREEVDALKSATTCDMHARMIEMAVQTGMRKSEMLETLWSHVDLTARTLRLDSDRTKSGRSRVIPLSDIAVSLLRTQPKTPGVPHLFWIKGRAGEPREMVHIYTWWNASVKRAGFKDLNFHDLRHTFASWWVQSGGSLSHLATVLGHSEVRTTDRYAHLGLSHIEREMTRLGLISGTHLRTHEENSGTQGGIFMR
jgi:integrase/recombinase XerD